MGDSAALGFWNFQRANWNILVGVVQLVICNYAAIFSGFKVRHFEERSVESPERRRNYSLIYASRFYSWLMLRRLSLSVALALLWCVCWNLFLGQGPLRSRPAGCFSPWRPSLSAGYFTYITTANSIFSATGGASFTSLRFLLIWCVDAMTSKNLPDTRQCTRTSLTQIFIKKTVTDGVVKNLSSTMLTFYLNLGQGMIAWGKQLQSHEFDAARRLHISNASRRMALAVPMSCLFGLGIGYFGFSVRRKISATAFTVLGCLNKLLSLGFDVVWLWGTAGSPSIEAVFSLLLCIMGGLWYSIETMKLGAVARPRGSGGDGETEEGNSKLSVC